MFLILHWLTFLITAPVLYAASMNFRDTPVRRINMSYLMGVQKVTWTEAYVMCKQNGMELLSITTEEEQQRVNEFIASSKNQATGLYEGHWLGAVRLGACGPDFVWLTILKPLIYRNFAPGQPDNAANIENCLHIFANADKSMSWNDIPCQTKLKFICQVVDMD